MNSDQEWATDLPYIINNSSSFVIPSGKTLTIDPDAVVKFDGGYAAMTVNGTLSAQQGAIPDIVNIVYFTSIHDDTVGGDTNGNGDATLPETYDWEEIKINSGGSATLEHSFIGYGGYYDCHANLCNDGGTLNVSTSTIAYGGTYGIYHAGGATNVSQSVFRNNGGYGLYNSTLATTTATGNYWGSVTGPYNAI
jgi:hypothetical protein